MGYGFVIVIVLVIFLLLVLIIGLLLFTSNYKYLLPKPDAVCVTSNPLPKVGASYILSNNNIKDGPYYFRYVDCSFVVTTHTSEATPVTYTEQGYLQVDENAYLKVNNGSLRVVCSSPTIWTFTSSGFITDTNYVYALTLAESAGDIFTIGQKYIPTDLIQCGWIVRQT